MDRLPVFYSARSAADLSTFAACFLLFVAKSFVLRPAMPPASVVGGPPLGLRALHLYNGRKISAALY